MASRILDVIIPSSFLEDSVLGRINLSTLFVLFINVQHQRTPKADSGNYRPVRWTVLVWHDTLSSMVLIDEHMIWFLMGRLAEETGHGRRLKCFEFCDYRILKPIWQWRRQQDIFGRESRRMTL
jgi:hypothetical protein